MNVANYLEQHTTIATQISIIKKLVQSNDLEKNAGEIALHINALAGKITIHLSMEDKYLYPRLIESKNLEVQKLAERYQKEMGSLAENFVRYKDKYNTGLKILGNRNELVSDTDFIFNAIEKRVEREEKELYKLID